MDAIALPQFDIRQEDIDYGNCTKFYEGTGNPSGYSRNNKEVYFFISAQSNQIRTHRNVF